MGKQPVITFVCENCKEQNNITKKAYNAKKNKTLCSKCVTSLRNKKMSFDDFYKVCSDNNYSVPVNKKWWDNNYKNSKTKMTLKCLECDILFERTVQEYLVRGNLYCKSHSKLNTNKAKYNLVKNWNTNKTTYKIGSKNYTLQDKAIINCLLHGEVPILVSSYIRNGKKCPKCLTESNCTKLSYGEFINTEYEWKVSVNEEWWEKHYTTSRDTEIICHCEEHGEFSRTVEQIRRGTGCPKCYVNSSVGEDELKNFIESLGFKTEKVRSKYEIDIYVPSKNIGFEYNGAYYHSEMYHDKNYHVDKERYFSNIDLFTVWEHDWNSKKEIVKSMIKAKLGVIENKIYARKCIVKNVSIANARNFLNSTHIQGYVPASVYLGLYYNNELCSIMSFVKSSDGYILNRFSSSLNVIIIGSFTKLLKHFSSIVNEDIFTFSDNMYSKGELYKNNGFTKQNDIPPDYKYLYKGRVYHKFSMRKNKLEKLGAVGKTEHEMALSINAYRVYDSGKIKWKYNKEQT